jgi:hypothetical protein
MKKINNELRRTQNELTLPFFENFALFASFAVHDFFHYLERKGRKDSLIGLYAINHRGHREKWQSSAIPVTTYEKAAASRFRTRMTRIFTYPCASVSSVLSVFYFIPSAFICVHLRLIFVSLSDRIREIKFGLFPIQEKIEPANNNQAHSCLNLLENKPQINADERRFVNLNILQVSEVYQENSLTESMQGSAIPISTYETVTASRFRTQMTRIARIFTDIFDRFASLFNSPDNKPQRSQRTQSRIAKLCALGVLFDGLTLFTAWLTRINTYPRASASTVAPVDVAHTYGSRHTWRSTFYFIPSAFICVHLRLISVSLSDRAQKIKGEI